MKIPNWKRLLNENQKLQSGVSLLKLIEKAGKYEAYLVGGVVRDLLFKHNSRDPIKDIDITTNCPLQNLDSLLTIYEIGNSRNFGTVIVLYKGFSYDVTNFRKDGTYSDNRRPDYVKPVSSLKEDVSRRDFTINAVAIDKTGEVVDYVGGLKDYKNKILRAVGNPEERFKEDHVRLIRALRFAATKNLDIEINTAKAIKKMANLVNKITPERIRMEFKKVSWYGGKSFAKFIIMLEKFGLLYQLLPEVFDLQNCYRPLRSYTKSESVFNQTIKALRKCSNRSPFEMDFLSIMGVLLQNVGQTEIFWQGVAYKSQKNSIYSIIPEISSRLGLSSHEKLTIIHIVKNRGRWKDLLNAKPSRISTISKTGYFRTLINVYWAYESSTRWQFIVNLEFNKFLDKKSKIEEKWDYFNFSIDGNEIMKLTGLKPSRLVGKLKERVKKTMMDKDLDKKDLELIKSLIIDEYEKLKGDCYD